MTAAARRRELRRRLAALTVEHLRAHRGVTLAAEHFAAVAVEYAKAEREARRAGVKIPKAARWPWGLR